MDISNQIKTRREAMGLSQEQLAEKLYVSRQTISNWERDKTYPDVQSLLMLSAVSYTHLDVYKRQQLHRGRAQARPNLACREEERSQTLLTQLVDQHGHLGAHLPVKRVHASRALIGEHNLGDAGIRLATSARDEPLGLQALEQRGDTRRRHAEPLRYVSRRYHGFGLTRLRQHTERSANARVRLVHTAKRIGRMDTLGQTNDLINLRLCCHIAPCLLYTSRCV